MMIMFVFFYFVLKSFLIPHHYQNRAITAAVIITTTFSFLDWLKKCIISLSFPSLDYYTFSHGKSWKKEATRKAHMAGYFLLRHHLDLLLIIILFMHWTIFIWCWNQISRWARIKTNYSYSCRNERQDRMMMMLLKMIFADNNTWGIWFVCMTVC